MRLYSLAITLRHPLILFLDFTQFNEKLRVYMFNNYATLTQTPPPPTH